MLDTAKRKGYYKTMSIRKIRNTSKVDLNVIGVGIVAAGTEVTVSSEYQPHIVFENYPGLVDVTDEGPVEQTQDTSEGQDNG